MGTTIQPLCTDGDDQPATCVLMVTTSLLCTDGNDHPPVCWWGRPATCVLTQTTLHLFIDGDDHPPVYRRGQTSSCVLTDTENATECCFKKVNRNILVFAIKKSELVTSNEVQVQVLTWGCHLMPLSPSRWSRTFPKKVSSIYFRSTSSSTPN